MYERTIYYSGRAVQSGCVETVGMSSRWSSWIHALRSLRVLVSYEKSDYRLHPVFGSSREGFVPICGTMRDDEKAFDVQ